MIDVVLVISDSAQRRSLAADLHALPDLYVSCATGEPDAMESVLAAHDRPRVLVLDAGLVGLWVHSRMRAGRACAHVVLHCTRLDAPDVLFGIEHGVHGCLPSNAGPVAWRDAIVAVAAGEYWIPRALMAQALMRLAEPPPSAAVATTVPDGLTPRQQQIVQWVAEGLGNKAIAQRLGISPTTVKTHLQNIFERSGIHGRQRLAVRALRGPAVATAPGVPGVDPHEGTPDVARSRS